MFAIQVDALYLPYEDTKRTILELFFEIFRLQTPEWSDDFAMALKQPSDIRNQTKLFSEHLETYGRFFVVCFLFPEILALGSCLHFPDSDRICSPTICLFCYLRSSTEVCWRH